MPRRTPKQRFVVEGCWADNDGADPITEDWVAATSADEATAIVTKVRSAIDNWTHAVTRSFEHHISAERKRLKNMRWMSIAAVNASWEETKEHLNYEDETDDATHDGESDTHKDRL